MLRRTMIALTCALSLASAPPALAKTVQGVTFPDTATVGGQSVTLNGMGVRVAYIFVKVYVGGLYLATPTHDAGSAIRTDEPKRMLLQFLRDVTHEEMVNAMREGFAHTASAALQPQVDQFSGFFTQPLVTGSQASFDYVPGTGTTVTIGGQVKGTIPGPDFMRALWGIWLGDKPADASLKAGLLGTD
ncbi:chalcone isomerase family protein [Candidatus Binatia bacterium]|nr:chalcone isomerase family protein [Candidatus Binatia bacterium]